MPLPSWKEWRENHEKAENVEPEPILEVEAIPDQMGEVFDQINVNEETITKLNEASEEDLLQIKGIGPKTAKKIIANRPFSDLEGVPISPALVEKFRTWASS